MEFKSKFYKSPEQLRLGAMSGHMFETFAVSEVLKSYMNAGRDTRDVSFYRDSQKREIDLVIREGQTLHPVEIKAGVQVRQDAVKNFRCLEGMSDCEVGFGHVICQTAEAITRPVLVGQSMGGYVAQAFMSLFPDVAKGFASVDSCPPAAQHGSKRTSRSRKGKSSKAFFRKARRTPASPP